MDPRRFDEMARRMARTLPRRTVIEGSAGAWLWTLLSRDARVVGKRKRKRKRKTDEKACTSNGKKCGRERNLRSCAKCCSGYAITTRSKKSKCACRPDGERCTRDDQCCALVCFDRQCGATS